jgi:hypothetical protein
MLGKILKKFQDFTRRYTTGDFATGGTSVLWIRIRKDPKFFQDLDPDP